MLCKNINELFSSSIEEFNFEYDAYNFLIVQITSHLKILNSGAIGDCGGLYGFFFKFIQTHYIKMIKFDLFSVPT